MSVKVQLPKRRGDGSAARLSLSLAALLIVSSAASASCPTLPTAGAITIIPFDPQIEANASESFDLLASQLGAATNGAPLTITGASATCGSVSVAGDALKLTYTVPSSGTTCDISYSLTDGASHNGSGTAKVTIISLITLLNPSLTFNSAQQQSIPISTLVNTHGRSAEISTFVVPSGCGSRTIAGNKQSVTYTAPTLSPQPPACSPPTTKSCAITYTAKDVATNTTLSGSVNMTIVRMPATGSCQ